MKAEHDLIQIAMLLGQHKSTICREMSSNNGSQGYRPKQASEMSADRAHNSRNARTMPLWVNVQTRLLLQFQWSPEQIASKLPISHETAHLRVYADKAEGGIPWENLRRQKQKRKRYTSGRDRRGADPQQKTFDRVSSACRGQKAGGSLGVRHRIWH